MVSVIFVVLVDCGFLGPLQILRTTLAGSREVSGELCNPFSRFFLHNPVVQVWPPGVWRVGGDRGAARG